MTDNSITPGPEWTDSSKCLHREIREVLAPPERVLHFWIGPPQLTLIGRDDVRTKLLSRISTQRLEPVLLFGSRRFSRRVVAWGRHARSLFKNDLKTAGDFYWWAYDTVFANSTQDLEMVILGHPDGTDFALVAWGVGCEEFVHEAFTLLREFGAAPTSRASGRHQSNALPPL